MPCWCLVAGAWLLVLACVILIPYERTRIEVLTGACYWCLLLVLTALQVRALLVLACVILITYERTCIEVLAGACWCGTDTL